MLTLSYAQALADPTYCEAGHTHGERLASTMGVKHNEPVPLKVILPHCTLPEFLWCLRAVRKSQFHEAQRLATEFVMDIVKRVAEDIGRGMASTPQKEQQAKIGEALYGWDGKESLSQIAIDVSNLALRYFADDPKAEEQRQRAKLKELIDG